MPAFTVTELLHLINECWERSDDEPGIEVTEAHEHADLADLGFDSLGLFNVMTALGERFGVKIAYADLAQGSTPAQMLTLINAIGAQVSSGASAQHR